MSETLFDYAERNAILARHETATLPMAEGPLVQRHKGIKRHGYARHGQRLPEYNIWATMLRRCLSPSCAQFAAYGAVGIKVCQRWKDSFLAFYADMGPRPSLKHSIDRYPNQRGNYEPSNCRWATTTEQMNNRRTKRLFTINGQTMTLAQLARSVGKRSDTIAYRLKNGWTLEAAISTTPNHANNHV